VLVCNEALMPEVATRRVDEGAVYLVNPSNDSWLEEERWADTMLATVSLRAVEQRRWLVRASTSGPSAIVDPWGRVRARTGHASRATLAGEIRPRREKSLYGRLGDCFGVACAGIALGAWVVGSVRRPHTRPTAASARSAQ
jgi:apolipoprotein N-acyltransferase